MMIAYENKVRLELHDTNTGPCIFSFSRYVFILSKLITLAASNLLPGNALNFVQFKIVSLGKKTNLFSNKPFFLHENPVGKEEIACKICRLGKGKTISTL